MEPTNSFSERRGIHKAIRTNRKSSPNSINSASSSPLADIDFSTAPTRQILHHSVVDVFEEAGASDSNPEPAICITRSHRRSNSMSKCMMTEKMTWRATGRDSEGFPKFAIQMEECQGLRINRSLRLNHSSRLGFFDSDDDYDSSDSERGYEPVLTIS